MARSTHRDDYRVEPKPIGQAVWLLATMAIAAIIVSIMGSRLAEVEGDPAEPTISGQDLLELAAPTPAGATRIVATGHGSAEAGSSNHQASGKTAPTIVAGPLDRLTGERRTSGTGSDASTAIEPPSRRDRGRAALDTISYPWEQLLPGWTIEFLPERDGLFGLTLVPEQRIEVYVRDGQSTDFLAHVIAHELGHAVDVTLNTGPDRRRWEAARDIGSSQWWPGDGTTDFSTGAGDFAESFAAWQVGSQSFRSKLGGPPDVDQIELLAELSAG